MTEMTNCLFEEPWWLDIVAKGAWQAAEVRRNGVVVARWPYVTTTLKGIRVLTMPELTQTLGPWLATPTGSYAKGVAAEYRLLDDLLDQLPDHDLFVQSLHPSRWTWLPMHWTGFRTSARLTYRIDDTASCERIWAGMRTDVRTQIRRAGGHLTLREDGSAEEFLPLHRAAFARQGMEVPWSLDTVVRVIQRGTAAGCARVLVAEDAAGRPRAAIVVVWDHRAMYYLLAGSDRASRMPGAIALLLWRAIRLAGDLGVAFDFEGSMLRPVERMFRAFGARQRPYLQLWRSNGQIEDLARPGELPPDTFQRLCAGEPQEEEN